MQHVYQSPIFFDGSAATPLRTVRRVDCLLSTYAHLSLPAVLKKLDTQHQGLSFSDVLNRLMKQGLNRVAVKKDSAPDLAAYAKMMSQQSCTVRRQNPVAGHEGSYQGKVSASLLVPGDMVLLAAGDWVPADLRLINQDNLVLERMVLQAWPDSCAMGDKVIAGTAQAVVVATGEQTLLSLLMQMPQQKCREQEHRSGLASWRHSLLRLAGSCALMLAAGGLALHSAASHAETELSLYGTLDTGMSWTRISGHGHRTGLEEGGQTDSLWGLRGQEDLGGGTYANFRLEGGLNLLTGSAEEPDRLFNYQSWLGLSNEQWGELRFGRQYTVGQEFVSELEIAGWKDFGMGALMRASDNYQVSSAATWVSPEWSGFQLGVTHSRDVGERDWEKNRKQLYSVAGRYENGPWQVAASFERLQRVSVNSSDKARAPQATQLALSYDFGSVRLATAWSRQQNGFVGRNGEEAPASLEDIGLDGLGPEEFINGGRLDTWYLGAAVELGGGEVQMQWALGKPNWTWEDTGSKARKMQVMSLGYVYPLSPRTSLYAFAAHGKHYDPENVVTAAEPHSNRVAVGLTHHF